MSVSGGWVQYSADAAGRDVPRFLGAGVITNRGETASRLLARPGCFELLLRHELGHALGLLDSPDGAGVMSPTLACDMGFGGASAVNNATRPTFVPLQTGASVAGKRVDVLEALACTVGCDIQSSVTITSPTAPQALAYTLSGSILTLTWNVLLEGDAPTAYIIEAGSSSGAADVASFSTGSTATSFVATVGGNALFYIRVRSRTAAGTTSPPSNEVIVAVGNATLPPGAPTALTATASGSTVTLQWTAATTGGAPSGYIIEVGSSSGSANLANFSTGSTSTTLSSADVPAGTYFVRVRGTNASGSGAPSNEVVIFVGASSCVVPGAPANLSATISGSTVNLTWTAGLGASTYQVQAGSTAGASNLADFDSGSPSTTLTAVVGPGTYFVRLRSKSACGQSALSNELVIIIR